MLNTSRTAFPFIRAKILLRFFQVTATKAPIAAAPELVTPHPDLPEVQHSETVPIQPDAHPVPSVSFPAHNFAASVKATEHAVVC